MPELVKRHESTQCQSSRDEVAPVHFADPQFVCSSSG
jgi:hypothetical protein